MPKYWVKNYFTHGRFPEVGQKQKRNKDRKKERLNDGNNNGTYGARMAHAWRTHGARKPPGPTSVQSLEEVWKKNFIRSSCHQVWL